MEGSGIGLIWGTIQIFSWMDWEKSKQTLASLTTILLETQISSIATHPTMLGGHNINAQRTQYLTRIE